MNTDVVIRVVDILEREGINADDWDISIVLEKDDSEEKLMQLKKAHRRLSCVEGRIIDLERKEVDRDVRDVYAGLLARLAKKECALRFQIALTESILIDRAMQEFWNGVKERYL